MAVKTSVSLTEAQEKFARSLVARGHFSSLSAVIQHGLDRLASEEAVKQAELDGLRTLLEARSRGDFIPMDEGDFERLLSERERDQDLSR